MRTHAQSPVSFSGLDGHSVQAHGLKISLRHLHLGQRLLSHNRNAKHKKNGNRRPDSRNHFVNLRRLDPINAPVTARVPSRSDPRNYKIEMIDLRHMYYVLKWLGSLGSWLFRRGMYKQYYER
jgi:hypothetical protein